MVPGTVAGAGTVARTVAGIAAGKAAVSTVAGRFAGRKKAWIISAVVIALLIIALVASALIYNARQITVVAAPEVQEIASPVQGVGLPGAEPMLNDAELAAAARPIMDRAAQNSDLGELHAQVANGATGTQLWSQSSDQVAIPASSLKIMTAAAALLDLDHGQRLATRALLYDGTQSGSDSGDTVVLVGAGDPTLNATGSGFYSGGASLTDLAQQTVESLVEKQGGAGAGAVKVGRVVVDATLFSETFHDTWDRSGMAVGYIAPIDSIAVDAGRLDPSRDESARTETPAQSAGDEFAKLLKQELEEAGVSEVSTPEVTVATDASQLPGGSIAAEGAVNGNAEQMMQEGEKAAGQADASLLGQVESAPLVTRVRDMMVHSDNTLAESIAREVAIANDGNPTFAGGAQAVASVLTEHGFNLTGANFYDSSGLSTNNRLTADQLVSVINAAARPIPTDDRGIDLDAPGDENVKLTRTLRPLLDSFPVGAVSGTLANRYSGNTGAGYVRAKTGTLDGVSALAGYVITDGGEIVTFAMLSNEASVIPARAAADDAIGQLRAIH